MKQMLDKIDTMISAGGTIITASLASEVKDWATFIITIVAAILTMAFTIWRWYRTAMKDGKISADEVDDLVDKLQDQIDKLPTDPKHDDSGDNSNGGDK